MADLNELKKAAGVRAANMIESGMTVGLGTGSTAAYMVERLGERIQTEGLKVTAVSTSWSTTLQCRKLGIPLIDLGEATHLDIAIDGADEIDPAKNLIKGRGAAHLLEKIVASMADNYIIIADSGKKVQTLGEKFAVAAVFSGKDGEWKYAVSSKTKNCADFAKAINAAFSGRGGGKPELVQGSCGGKTGTLPP